MKILVIDDDVILVDLLKRSLSSQRYIVEIAEDGQIGWDYVQTGEYELILLDVDLPRINGISLCEKIRSEGYKTPILLMTAKNASQDRILGLDAGADDYLTKPLDLEELNARVRALSRRGEVATTSVLDVNGLILDPSSCEVSYQDRPIKLTAKEYSLLEIFLRNPARVFSRSQIVDKIWTFDDPPLEESVKAHVKGLRKKLKKAGIVDWIENVYGIGYRLNPKVAESEAKDSRASVEQEFEQKMSQTWLKYQDKMSERLKVLQNAVAAIKKANLSPELHRNAERAAHKLAGVLGMFSKDTGTDIAREIETLLQDNSVLNAREQEHFISLVTDLDSLLALERTSTNIELAENLLLICADTQLTKELQQLSRTQGLNWHQVDNITQAQTWLEENSPQLAVIDTEINNSQPEYLSFVTELNSRIPAIPAIVLSDTKSLRDRVTATRAGANSFLVKPVNSSTIWHTTNQLIEQNQIDTTSVLIVDDDLVFLAALRSILEPWGIKVATLCEPLNFWTVLQVTQPDLVILDIDMPEIDGIQLCQALRSDPDWQELPVLFLTARQDAQTIQQVFEIGGDDYISKPVVGAELIARINNRLDRSRLLHNLATQDRLTRLTNRTQSSREIESLLRQAQDRNCSFCLAVLKITELQQINLKYGHATGDRILAQWGKVIQAAFRNDEITSYWGNGDFIIGLPNLNKVQGKERLAELSAILRKQIFTSPEGDCTLKEAETVGSADHVPRRDTASLKDSLRIAHKASRRHRFQVNFHCAVAELIKDGNTIHSLYQACNGD